MKHYKPWYKKVVEATKKIKFNRWPLYWKSLLFSAGAGLGISAIVVGATRVNETTSTVNYNLSNGVDVTLRVELPENAADEQEINYSLDSQTAIAITNNYLTSLQTIEGNNLSGARIDPGSIQASDGTISFTINEATIQEINRLSSVNNNEAFSGLFGNSLFGFGNGSGALFRTDNTLSNSTQAAYYGADIIAPNSFSGSVTPPATAGDNPISSTISFNVSNTEAWNGIVETATSNSGNGTVAFYFSRIDSANSSSEITNLFMAASQGPQGARVGSLNPDLMFNEAGEVTNPENLGAFSPSNLNDPTLLSAGRFTSGGEDTGSTITMVVNTVSSQLLNQTIGVLNSTSLTDTLSLVSILNAPAVFTQDSGNGFYYWWDNCISYFSAYFIN